ncbi:hypothetical protein PS918_02550 [Pseudomonas fluorescens]|uniref:Uncharacterized protein n=1 Tax=Pseudomonas fluorescens TaxID=294 RepID=A0A5E7SAK8_PSEFL|nr:hypothetical protein PS918_02550 [Pseudomonas fluorescens]
MLAMDVNDNAPLLNERVARSSIASRARSYSGLCNPRVLWK